MLIYSQLINLSMTPLLVLADTNRPLGPHPRAIWTTRSPSTRTRCSIAPPAIAARLANPWETRPVTMVNLQPVERSLIYSISGAPFACRCYRYYIYSPITFIAIHSYRSPPKPGYGFKTTTLPYIRNGYSSVSAACVALDQILLGAGLCHLCLVAYPLLPLIYILYVVQTRLFLLTVFVCLSLTSNAASGRSHG